MNCCRCVPSSLLPFPSFLIILTTLLGCFLVVCLSSFMAKKKKATVGVGPVQQPITTTAPLPSIDKGKNVAAEANLPPPVIEDWVDKANYTNSVSPTLAPIGYKAAVNGVGLMCCGDIAADLMQLAQPPPPHHHTLFLRGCGILSEQWIPHPWELIQMMKTVLYLLFRA